MATLVIVCAVILAVPASAHRAPCHWWHSCPPDRAEYVCGDMGQCAQCPDNRYCEMGKRRIAAGGELGPVREQLDACTTEATGKNLTGDELTAFMIDCMRAKTP